MRTIAGVDGLEITGATGDGCDEVRTPRAPALVTLLHREVDGRRLEVLSARQERVRAPADGADLGSLAETAHVRETTPGGSSRPRPASSTTGPPASRSSARPWPTSTPTS